MLTETCVAQLDATRAFPGLIGARASVDTCLQAQGWRCDILQAEAVAKAAICKGPFRFAAHGIAIIAEGDGAGFIEIVRWVVTASPKTCRVRSV